LQTRHCEAPQVPWQSDFHTKARRRRIRARSCARPFATYLTS
jgi:hypothetical protein